MIQSKRTDWIIRIRPKQYFPGDLCVIAVKRSLVSAKMEDGPEIVMGVRSVEVLERKFAELKIVRFVRCGSTSRYPRLLWDLPRARTTLIRLFYLP